MKCSVNDALAHDEGGLPREIVCACLAGLAIALIVVGMVSDTVLRMGRSAPGAARLVTFAGFAAFQIAAMWISFTPSIANR